MLEKEVEQLKEQIASARSSVISVDNSKTNEEYEQRLEDADKKIASKEYEIQRLVKKVEKLIHDMDTKDFTLAARIDGLECQNNDNVQEINLLQGKLEKQKDYESIKRDLAILRSLEGDTNIDDIGTSDGESKKPVEVLILERSKALQTENTSLRMDKERLGSALDKVNSELASKCSEFEVQTTLVKELETHVEKLQQITTTSYRGEADGGRSSTDILKELDILGGSAGHSSKTSSVILADDNESNDPQSTPTVGIKDQEHIQQASYMLPIIQVNRIILQESFKT